MPKRYTRNIMHFELYRNLIISVRFSYVYKYWSKLPGEYVTCAVGFKLVIYIHKNDIFNNEHWNSYEMEKNLYLFTEKHWFVNTWFPPNPAMGQELHGPWFPACTLSFFYNDTRKLSSWWRHQIKTFSALLVIYVGNSPVTGEFPTKGQVTRSFDFFFDMNKRLSKQS